MITLQLAFSVRKIYVNETQIQIVEELWNRTTNKKLLKICMNNQAIFEIEDITINRQKIGIE